MPTRPDDLVLYVGQGCGYCADVIATADELGLEIEERDAWMDASHLEDLVAARGRRTVPVLRIHHADGAEEWMGESTVIIDYLHERFGDPQRRRSIWTRWASHRATVIAMWGLLLAGGVASGSVQSGLWLLAVTIGAARSFTFAVRSGAWIHWLIGAAFTAGAVSIALRALGVADVAWWPIAFAVPVIALGGWARRARRRAKTEPLVPHG